MIVHGDSERALSVVLADAIQVKLAFDIGGLGNFKLKNTLARFVAQFFVEDVFADDDATVADVNTRPLNELFDFGVRLAAETAEGELRGSSHVVLCYLVTSDFSTRPGISLRDWTTSSTSPYDWASSELMKSS